VGLFDELTHPPAPDSLLTHSPKWAQWLAQQQAQGITDKHEHMSLLFHDMAGDSDVVMPSPDVGSQAAHVQAAMPALDSAQRANYMLMAIAHNHPWHGYISPGASPEFPRGGYAPGDPSSDDVNMARTAQIPSYVTNQSSVYRIGPDGHVAQWDLGKVLAALNLTPGPYSGSPLR